VFDISPEIDVLEIGDITEAVNLEEQATRTGWTRNDVTESMRAGNLCYKLLKNKIMHGYCVVRIVGSELEILNIVISRQLQGQGLGGFFLENILQKKDVVETTDQWLEVRSGNLAAQALYQKSGFKIVGKRRGYYSRSENYEDALIMRRSTSGILKNPGHSGSG
jgi:ribosomal-protein-alanine N-acetyltransferase